MNASRRRYRSVFVSIVLAGAQVPAVLAMAAPAPDAGCDALEYALGFAGCISDGEEFAAEKSKALTVAAQAAIRRGELARAAAIGGGIPTWQRGQVYAEVARANALAGKPDEARRLIARAEVWAGYIKAKNEDGTLGWQAERIGLYVASVKAALGDSGATALALAANEEGMDPEVLTAIVEAATHPVGTGAIAAAVGGAVSNRSFVVQQGILKGLLGWAEKRPALASNELDTVVAYLDQGLDAQPFTVRIALQYRTAALLRNHGRAAEAQGRVESVERSIRGLSSGLPRALALGEAASYLLETDASQGLAKLDQAATELWQPVTAPGAASQSLPAADAKHAGRPLMLAQMAEIIAADRTPAYCALADIAARGGQPARARTLYALAFHEAVAQSNPAPRLLRLSDICSRMAANRVAPEPAFRQELDRQLQAEKAKH